MDNDKGSPPEDFPIDGEMCGIDPAHPFLGVVGGRLARLRQLSIDADGGSIQAIDELLKTALLFAERVDFKNETSPDRIVLASLKKPLEYLLGNKKVMRPAFGLPRKKTGRPRSTDKRNKELAHQLDSYLNVNNALTLKAAKDKVLTDINESMDKRTLERATKPYILTVAIERILTEKYRDKKK
jgi:hypothetical protein